jgi:hypothetical protein
MVTPGAAGARSFLEGRPHIILCCDCEGTRAELERMWRVIERAGVAANFFFVGETARAFPDLVREIASGQQAESHTMHHENLRKLDKTAQRRAILDGRHAVEDVIQRPTRGFRAPYHCLDRKTVELLNEHRFVFDASRLYYRYLSLGRVHEIVPTWFREWMPTYGKLGIRPRTAFGIFRALVRWRRLCVLPAHPQYSGMSEGMARGFAEFLSWAKDLGAEFWPIDKWLHVTRGVALPDWVSPLGPAFSGLGAKAVDLSRALTPEAGKSVP